MCVLRVVFCGEVVVGLLVNRGELTDTFSGPKNMPLFEIFFWAIQKGRLVCRP
jgi:hypothetical protein